MAKKAKGPNREDGYLLKSTKHMELRGYLVEDEGETMLKIWSFVDGTDPEEVNSLGPGVTAGIRRWFKELDAAGTPVETAP